MFVLIALLLLVAPASIFSDVAGFLTGGYKDLKELAGKVWGAIKHTLNFVTGIFRNVGAAWGDLHSAFRSLITGMESLAEGTYSAIRWLSQTLVPKWAKKAIADSVNWAVRNIKTVAEKGVKLANAAKTWASKRINSVLKTAENWFKSVRKTANTVLAWINDKGKRIWDLVMHPAKMVTWILPSLVTPLLRYIRDHLEAVSTLILRWGWSNIGKFALEIERAVTRVL